MELMRESFIMIRKGKIEDATQIAKLKIKNYRHTYKDIFSKEFLNSMSIKKEQEKYKKNLKEKNVLVYVENDSILGYIYYGKRKNFIDNYIECDGEIYAIYVDIKNQNKGIGSKLIKKALSDLVKKYNKIIIWCMTDNLKSVEFYQSKGFCKMDNILSNIEKSTKTETAFIYDFQDITKYVITRYCSFLEKDNITAVYTNFKLMFFKNQTVKWIKKIIDKDENYNQIPIDFYRYLLKNEVIELV